MSEERCDYSLERFPEEGYTVIEIAGHIGVEETEGLRKCFSREISNERPWMLLNLPEISFISSSGMSALLMAVADARSYGGDVIFVAIPEKVRKVLEFLDVLDFIRVVDTSDEAMGIISDGVAKARARATAGAMITVDREKDLLYEGINLCENGEYERALKAFETVLAENPNNEQALKWKITVLERLGRFTEARKLELESKMKGVD
ncbi:MAG: STAS domain-containing protein [Candidatus Coatesbacteria bacterium]|nr:MAG: STAS domain-containing protein [Candidatus Coatesbacteria bacterium]